MEETEPSNKKIRKMKKMFNQNFKHKNLINNTIRRNKTSR